jgi:hypothetical protein
VRAHQQLGDAGMRTSMGITTGRALCSNIGSELRCEYAMVSSLHTYLCQHSSLHAFKDSLDVVSMMPIVTTQADVTMHSKLLYCVGCTVAPAALE